MGGKRRITITVKQPTPPQPSTSSSAPPPPPESTMRVVLVKNTPPASTPAAAEAAPAPAAPLVLPRDQAPAASLPLLPTPLPMVTVVYLQPAAPLNPSAENFHSQASRALILAGLPPNIPTSDVVRCLESWGPVRSFRRCGNNRRMIVSYFDIRHAVSAVWYIARSGSLSFPVSTSAPAPTSDSNPRRRYEPLKHEFANVGFVDQQRHEPEPEKHEYHVDHPQDQVEVYHGNHSQYQSFQGVSAWFCGTYEVQPCNANATLVLHNPKPNVREDEVRAIFQAYGEVLEVRSGSRVKFIEFYDVREAQRALMSLNGAPIWGKPISLTYSTKYHRGDGSREPWYQNFNHARFSQNHGSSIKYQVIPFNMRDEQRRTTLMFRNIPSGYSKDLLLRELDMHCEKYADSNPASAYDFVYIPIDRNTNANLGYAFVNMTTVEATIRLYREFNMKPWKLMQSYKMCQVVYARIQGRENIKQHFLNRSMDTNQVIFDPPRTGRVKPNPVDIHPRIQFGDHPDSKAAAAS